MTKEERAQIRRLLWRWANVTNFCAGRQRELNEYAEMMDGVADMKSHAVVSSSAKRRTRKSTVEKAAERLEGLRELYKDRISDLVAEIETELDFAKAMGGAMRGLSKTERAVIEARYRRGRQFGEVARLMHYSEDRVKYIERGAVDKLSNKIIVKSEVNTFLHF